MHFISWGRKPPYQWCSGPLPIRGCTHTSHPCTARAQHSGSGRSVLHRWGPPSPLHTGKSLWSTPRGCHSPGYTALHRRTKVHHVEQCFHTANRLCIKTKSLLYEYHSSAGSNMGFCHSVQILCNLASSFLSSYLSDRVFVWSGDCKWWLCRGESNRSEPDNDMKTSLSFDWFLLRLKSKIS